MFQRAFLLGTALTLAGGCDKKVDGFEGVWVLITTPNNDPVEPDISLDENFIDASPGEEVENTVDWTLDEVFETSENLSFVQFIAGDKKEEGYLLIGSVIYPGVRNDKKSWTFEREFLDNQEDRMTHDSGYYYSESMKSTTKVTLTLTIDKNDTNLMTGDASMSGESVTRWEESDEWADPADWPDSAIDGVNTPLPDPWGEITTYSVPYLPEPVGNAEAENVRTESDCSDSFCFLQITSKSSESSTIELEKTDFDPEDIVFPAEDFTE